MTAFTRQASIVGGLLLAAAVAAPGSADAQRRQAPPENAPRFMVPTLRSTERGLGVQAADAIRQRLSQDFAAKDLWIIDKNAIRATLEASGFPPDEPPDRTTARLLAQNLRADEYLEGTVAKRPNGGFVIEANMVLTRDNSMVQPLGPAEGGRVTDAATQLSRALREARRQLADERACEVAIAAGKNEEAIAAARRAIATYPRSTIGRVCMAQAMVNLKMPGDSIIAVTSQALEIYPRLKPALLLAAQAYTEAKNEDKAVETWAMLVSTDPGNTQLVEQVANTIAGMGNAARAVPIIDTAVVQNPGNPDLVRTQFRIRLAARDWKKAIESGENLIKTDTAYADTALFNRLAVAYAADSQPQKAAETTARGVAKFPKYAPLLALHARMLRSAGQLQQSVEAARRALTMDPKNFTGHLALADIQVEMNQPDSAIATLRQALPTADSAGKVQAAQRLLVIGNNAYKAGVASKNRADFQRAVTILSFADTVASQPGVARMLGQASAQIKFLLGVSAFQIAASAAQENQRAKSCELAQMAQSNLTIAQINVPAGGQFAKEAAGQLMQQIPKFSGPVEAQVKRFCRGR